MRCLVPRLALLAASWAAVSGLAADLPKAQAAAGAPREAVVQLVKQAVAAGKQPAFEMDMGGQRVKARVVKADDEQVTVSAQGLTVLQPWAKLTPLDLLQMGLDLAGEDAAAQRKMAVFALGSDLKQEAQRTLERLIERDPRDAEALALLTDLEKSAAQPVKPAFPLSKSAAAPERPVQANYYIAPQGSDQNPGTFEAPFATLQHAVDAAKPGQLIYVRGGKYLLAGQTLFRKSGQPGAPIELRGYPGEEPVLDAGALPGSETTWRFSRAKHWKIRGPLHLTNGRGAGIYVDSECEALEFERVESSYNGKTAERGGHGFYVLGDGIKDVLFKNCDAHHNANHHTKPGENVEANIYQHGDGWRIFSGRNVRLVGCRAWHNLDDAYDLTQATEPIELVACWAAYSGVDDAKGSITGKPNWGIRRYDGDGFKLGYKGDTGKHRTIRCLAWNNFCHGWNVAGGPYAIHNCASFSNGEDAFFGADHMPHDLRNCYAFKNRHGNGVWAQGAAGLSVSPADFISLNDAGMLGPRQADGSLPETDFLRLVPGSALVDAGVDVGLPFHGRAPDIGPRESGRP